MANEVINIDFSTIDTCASRIAQEEELIQTQINEIHSCYASLDSRVKTQLGGEFDTSELETIKTRLEKTRVFLEEVKRVYSGADIDLSSSLSVDYLEYLYPNFKDLSDDRKAIVLSALRYLGLKGSSMGYANNFSSQYASSQFMGDTNHAWCAMFVGSIINYYYGNKSIIDPSYASVWKIIGNYGNQTGIAFETDDRIHYYVSQALVEKYKANGGFSDWERNLAEYNKIHGTNKKVTDWINDGFVPQPGDIIVFKKENLSSVGKNASLEEYNKSVDYNKASFIRNSKSRDYPNDTASYSHIGFVLGTREVNGVTYVDTVEGNVSDDVQVRSFRIDDPYLVGYGHIDYEKFESDKKAIQQMVATGVDTNASKATAGSMSQHLLALNNGDVKGNYLVNLANNIDKVGTEKLVLNQNNNTGQMTSDLSLKAQDPVATSTPQTTYPVTTSTVNSGTQTYQNTYSNVVSGGRTNYSSGSSSYISSKTSQAVPATQTTTAIIEKASSQETQTVTIPQQTVPIETQSVPQTVVQVVEQQPTVAEYSYVPPEEAPPVYNPVVEEAPIITNPHVIENPLPIVEEIIPEVEVQDPIPNIEQPVPIIPTASNPVQVIPSEINPTVSPKSSNFGKVLLTSLGVGAGIGGAAYIANKTKKNREESTEEDEFDEEEEYDDEY